MNQFNTYFNLGLEHILDVNGIDHILFIIALCTIYSLNDWRKLLILITAFTIGHSLTLALSSLDFVSIDSALIETLIPITIIVTALSNIFINNPEQVKSLRINYFYAAFFGLIHGLGFSNYFKSLLGRDSTIINKLFAFNVGLEVGQILISCLFLAIGFLFLNILKINKRLWIIVVSVIVGAKALHLIIKNLG